MKKILSALSLSALVASSASAAVSPDPINTGDIILGFYSATEDAGLVVNLGAFQSFDNFDGASFNTRLDVADIASVYGAGWNTRTDLFWTVTGATTSTSELDGLSRNTIFSAQKRTDLGVIAAAPLGNNSATQATNDANAIRGISGGYNAVDTTQEGGFAVVQNGAAASTVSFRKFQVTTPTALFGTATDNSANGTSISDFYGMVPTDRGNTVGGNAELNGWKDGLDVEDGVNYLGRFELSASGLSFTAATASAIPEPSTFGALAGAAVLGLAATRRRPAVRA
jgi:hypothetical protein